VNSYNFQYILWSLHKASNKYYFYYYCDIIAHLKILVYVTPDTYIILHPAPRFATWQIPVLLLQGTYFSCLNNRIAPQAIASERERAVYTLKRLVLGFRFCGSDVIREVGFWPFWLMLPSLRPNRYLEVFH